MSRKYRKPKTILTALEQGIALLHSHRFEVESMEEMRQSLLRQYITSESLSPRQVNAVYKLAAPLRAKAKKVRAKRRGQKHYVYAISDGACVKIGRAIDPQKRLADLQVANPSRLKLEAKIECPRFGDASRLEKKLHRACERYHIRGEWFELDAMCVFDNYT